MGVNQEMKMIGHQAVGKKVTSRQQIFLDLPQKIRIIFGRQEDALFVVSPVENMIEVTLLEMHAAKVVRCPTPNV